MEAQREQFDKIFQDHLSEVQRLIARHTRDPEERLDLTQEVFIRAYSAFSQFRGDSSVRTWLYRIAINVCANAARSHSRHQENVVADAESMAHAPGLRDAIEDLAHAEEQRMLKQALRSVSAEQLVVLTLRFSDQLTLPEIAGVVGAPVDTVRSRLRNALEKIQSTMAFLSLGVAAQESPDPRIEHGPGLWLEDMALQGDEGGKVYHNLGHLYLRKGMVEAALTEWRKAQKAAPTFLDAYLASAQQYIEMDNPRQAIETLETAISKIHSGELHTLLARAYLNSGDVEDGMTHALRGVELEPKSPVAHYEAGRAYYKQAELQEALRSLTVGGGAESVATPLESRWRKSADCFREALRLDPRFVRASSFLAGTYLRQHDPQGALQESQRAAEGGGEDDFVLHQAGWVHYSLGREALAERYLRHSISLKPSPEKLSLLGTIHLAQDRAQEALACFDEALDLVVDSKTRAQLYSNVAAAAIRLGRCEAAINAAREALRLDPGLVHARCNLSEAYLASDADVQEVVRLCREGLQMAPDHTCFHHLLAEAFLRQGELDDALLEATSAVEIEPGNSERWLLRASILAELGRSDEARRDVSAALELDGRSEAAADMFHELARQTE